MDINKNIENATYFINKIKEDLPNIKNKKQQDFTIDMLNSFIVLINSFEVLKQRDPLMKVIESLLIERMYRDCFHYSADGVGLPLQKIFDEIIADIRNPVSAQLEKMVSYLKMEEVGYLCKTDQLHKLNEVNAESWEVLIKEKLNDFKSEISWVRLN